VVLSYVPVSSLLSFRGIIICAGIFSLKVWHIIIAIFRGIIGNFRGIIICAGIFRGIIGNFRGIYYRKLPWYYRKLPWYC